MERLKAKPGVTRILFWPPLRSYLCRRSWDETESVVKKIKFITKRRDASLPGWGWITAIDATVSMHLWVGFIYILFKGSRLDRLIDGSICIAFLLKAMVHEVFCWIGINCARFWVPGRRFSLLSSNNYCTVMDVSRLNVSFWDMIQIPFHLPVPSHSSGPCPYNCGLGRRGPTLKSFKVANIFLTTWHSKWHGQKWQL